MPKFLNNIDLNSNQLLSPVIHVSSQSTATNGPAGNTTGTEGQIFYNSHAKALYFRDDSAWRPIGDISGVTAGVGLSGGGTGGDVTLTIDFSEFSDVTPVNGDKLATLDSDGSTEQLTTIASLATLFAGSGLTATNSVIAVDTLNQSTTGSAGTVTDIGSMNAGDVTSGGTNNRTLTLGDAKVTMAKLANISSGTLMGRSASGAGVPTALGPIAARSILNVDNGAQAHIAPTADEVKAALNGAIDSNELFLGNSNTTTAVAGNLTITGVTTMSGGTVVNTTTNTAIKDTTIVLNSGIGENANAADIGMLFDRGTLGNAFMGWDESEDEFIMIKTSTEGSDDGATAVNGTATGVAIENDAAYLALKVGSIELANGGINLAGHAMNDVDITSESTDADDHLMSALAIKNRIEDFGYTTNTGTTTASNTQTFTNKSIDANGTGNAITNIDIGNMTAGVIQLSSETFADNDTSLMTSAALLDKFAVINANTSGTAGGLSTTLAVSSGGTGATSLDGAGIVEKTGAQTISGLKTFSGGLILDDGTTAAPIIKWINSDDDEFTIFNNASGKLKFQQKLVGGTMTNRATLDENGLDVDNGLSVGGSAVHATDTTTSLGTSDTVVPSQKAVKTYVDAQGSSSSNTGGRNAFVLNNSVTGVAVSNSNKTYTITHGMGDSLNYGVEVFRAVNGSGETVYTDVTRTTTTIVIEFAVAPTAGDYTALVCKY